MLAFCLTKIRVALKPIPVSGFGFDFRTLLEVKYANVMPLMPVIYEKCSLKNMVRIVKQNKCEKTF